MSVRFSSTRKILSVFVPIVLGLAGCSTTGMPPAPATAASPNYNYIIGPGDMINVVVRGNPDLSVTVPVRPDGKITTPLAKDIVAIGKDSTALSHEIEAALKKYINEPTVDVIVTTFVGPYSEQIRVVGEASKPQVLPYKQKMTLLDVMIAVGGVTDFADGNHASILRTAEGNKQYSIKIADLLKRGDISANVEMRPGDVVIIPQGWF